MAAPRFMDRFGARLVANGYPIIPIQPGTKKPGCHRGGGWRDYPDWTRHAARATTELELAQWRGLARRRHRDRRRHRRRESTSILPTMPSWRIASSKLARERLGDTPALRIGRPPKRLLVYRTVVPFKGIKRHPLEVLCLGQQFVAYAIHPATGRPYEWPDENLAELDLGSLPAIDEAKARAFLDEAIALLPEQLRPAQLPLGMPAKPAPATPSRARRRRCARRSPGSRTPISITTAGCASAWRSRAPSAMPARNLFAAWSAQSAKNDRRRHRQDLGRLQARAHRRRHALSPRHRARLEAGCGAGARWLGAARRGASGGRVAGEGAERSGRADAGPT